jgi:Flp pilus assembly protein TadD
MSYRVVRLTVLVWSALFVCSMGVLGAQDKAKENNTQVEQLNRFSDELLATLAHWQDTRQLTTSERIGSYKDLPDYFREIEYTDKRSGKMLARIRWQRDQPELAQMIEIFLHDDQGRMQADYFVSYLIGHRNAPMFALINLYHGDDDLKAFRQFDIFGEKLFERCEGTYFDKVVDISIDEYAAGASTENVPEELLSACFGHLPSAPGKYVHPQSLVTSTNETPKSAPEETEFDRLQSLVTRLSTRLSDDPKKAGVYVERGQAYLRLNQMEQAASDFSKAIELNDGLDAAFFGRGMALGRLGQLEGGIADLVEFTRRNPESSIGFTKLGVRRIWSKDFTGAVDDLTVAVTLDDNNAEAHDDLGVALTQIGHIEKAEAHFSKSISIDPTYQKAHHNLAMSLYMIGDLEKALLSIDNALNLSPNTKNSLMLKSIILKDLGNLAEAEKVRERAEFLPEGNWSERSAIR